LIGMTSLTTVVAHLPPSGRSRYRTAIARELFAICSVIASFALASCHDVAAPTPVTDGGPKLVDVLPGTDPGNVLAARVVFTVTAADSVRITYKADASAKEATPFRTAKSGTDTIWVLGLRPATHYTYQIEALSSGASKTSSASSFQTASLPVALSGVQLQRISGSGAAHFILVGVRPGGSSTGGYAVAFDSSGALAWYHDFTSTGLNVSDVMQQPNGNITAFIGNTTGSQAVEGYYVEMTPEGDVVSTYRAGSGRYTDDHEILLTGSAADKKAHFITYSIRSTDLTELGGNPNVALAGHQIVRQNVSGGIEFEWNAWDHLGLDEWMGDTNVKQTANAGDFDHPNAIFIDNSGNYIVSWRNLDQVMAIDSQTGNVLWRVGGLNGQYTFVDDPLNGFSKQHSVKILPNGHLLLFDNGTDHDPQESRAVEYELDHSAKTARLVWEYRHDPPIYTQFVGWVQRFSSGNTYVAFALAGRAVEVNPSSQVVWEAQLMVNGSNATSYRLIPIASLYAYASL
jgi:hypothetical protein